MLYDICEATSLPWRLTVHFTCVPSSNCTTTSRESAIVLPEVTQFLKWTYIAVPIKSIVCVCFLGFSLHDSPSQWTDFREMHHNTLKQVNGFTPNDITKAAYCCRTWMVLLQKGFEHFTRARKSVWEPSARYAVHVLSPIKRYPPLSTFTDSEEKHQSPLSSKTRGAINH